MKPYSDRWYQACLTMAGINFDKNIEQKKVVDWWLADDEHRVCQLLGGERGGKSMLAAFLMMVSMSPEEEGEYWIVGPDYNQSRPEFKYLYDWLNDAGMVAEVSMPASETSPWSMKTIWGAKVRTRSGADTQKLASFKVSGVIMAEAAQQIYEGYLKLLGRISETGGFLILAGTLEKGLPWYAQLFERWQGSNLYKAMSFSLPTWSNREVYPGGRDDPKIQQLESEFPPDLFMERFGAVPQRKVGIVLDTFDMKTQVVPLKVNPELPVELAIDPGQHTYAALFVQYDGMVCNVLDRVYVHNQIVHEVVPQAMGNKLWKYIDPADAGVIDVAGTQHHANKSQSELWYELAGVTLFSKKRDLDDTIQVLKYRFGTNNPLHIPLVYFSDHMSSSIDPGSGRALDVLAEPMTWKWPDRGPEKNVPKKPIDKNNDAMKALGYSLLRRYGQTFKRRKRRTTKRSYW